MQPIFDSRLISNVDLWSFNETPLTPSEPEASALPLHGGLFLGLCFSEARMEAPLSGRGVSSSCLPLRSHRLQNDLERPRWTFPLVSSRDKVYHCSPYTTSLTTFLLLEILLSLVFRALLTSSLFRSASVCSIYLLFASLQSFYRYIANLPDGR